LLYIKAIFNPYKVLLRYLPSPGQAMIGCPSGQQSQVLLEQGSKKEDTPLSSHNLCAHLIR
jgi:hypothetical protein